MIADAELLGLGALAAGGAHLGGRPLGSGRGEEFRHRCPVSGMEDVQPGIGVVDASVGLLGQHCVEPQDEPGPWIGELELAGKGLIKCPYCGSEVFTSS